jgi:UDP-N-acetylmuramate dehydrogenase
MSRRKNQPLGHSPGCVFKNPSEIAFSAGSLIDKSGLKGYNVGNAQVSRAHGNFILNRGNAHCADVLTLIDIVREKVYKEFNLELNLELEIVSECLTKPASGLKGWSLSRAENRFS